MAEEGADVFRADIQLVDNPLNEREEVVGEDVFVTVFRNAPAVELRVTVGDGLGNVLSQLLDVVVGQRDGRGVGVGVHAVGAGQHALEDGGAVGQHLAGLLRHAVEGH